MVLVMEDANLDLQVSTSSSALSLSWNEVSATAYAVMCTSSEDVNSTELVYSSSHSIHLPVHNSTSAVLDWLIPGATYNCCVSAVGLPSYDDCVISVVQEGAGLPTPVVGLIGGVIGVLIALLVVLTIGVIVASVIWNTHR